MIGVIVRLVVDGVAAAALYEIGSRATMDDQRAFGEYQGPPPDDAMLRDGFASAYGPLIDHLDAVDRERAIDVIVAGYRGADPELVCMAREFGR